MMCSSEKRLAALLLKEFSERASNDGSDDLDLGLLAKAGMKDEEIESLRRRLCKRQNWDVKDMEIDQVPYWAVIEFLAEELMIHGR